MRSQRKSTEVRTIRQAQSDSSVLPALRPAFAINDSQARVAMPGEGTRLGVAREDSDLL